MPPNSSATAVKVQRPKPVKQPVIIPSTHSSHTRNSDYDLLIFFAPALFWKLTPIFPIFITGILRILSTHLLLTLHFIFVDKDNYKNKLPQKQLVREKDDYLVGILLHMWAQTALQLIFPGMFFADSSTIASSALNTFISHVVVVEPLYYFAHRWLHVPERMKKMHGFHHLSINTLPSTSLVQNFEEHFVYIATFGPAFLFPFIFTGRNHWTVVAAYLVLFDIINAFGHTNIRIQHWTFTHRYSPLKYLFYTPEFHLGHHAYFRYNYALFMPIWDHMLGTYREYKIPDPQLQPARKQDFVFIGHNGGLGHLFTCPEFSVYNVYDTYKRTFLPIGLEFLVMHIVGSIARLFMKFYTCSRYLVDKKLVGRIICIPRTPWDYMSPKMYGKMNQEIVDLIRSQYEECGTRYFGLGNLNKMKQLNDGGRVVAEMIREDPVLKDKNIRVWTGDSMTTASVYNQIMDLPEDLDGIFYIGANGKIGTAVCHLLAKNRPNLKICVFSRYHGIKLPNVTYSSDLSDMLNYRVAIVGKMLAPKQYNKALKPTGNDAKTRLILDYTVPFIPIDLTHRREIRHIQIGILATSRNTLIEGHYDICMSHDQDHIYPCHMGCILNMVEQRETNETGDINLDDVERLWNRAKGYGIRNKSLSY